MKHVQMSIKYAPKYQDQNKWYKDKVDLISYISYQSSDAIKDQTDSAQITFQQRIYSKGSIDSYNSGTYTITSSANDWVENQFRWFTLRDQKNNRYKIQSNTSNTITLVAPDEFNYPGAITPGNDFFIELPMFEIGDYFEIYVWTVTDGTFTTLDEDDLVFVGQIKTINDTLGPGGIQSIITLENMTEVLFKSFNNPKLSSAGTFSTFIDKIKDYVIEWTNQSNLNMLKIVWDDDNPTTKKDGITAFPDVDYYTDYKPNYEIINDLCQDKYTGDGEYYFYLKPNVNSTSHIPEYLFVLRPKLTVSEDSLKEGTDFKFVNRTKDKGDVVSFLIIRCGRDLFKNNITAYVWGDLRHGYLGKPVAVNFAGDIIDWEIIKDKEASGGNYDDNEPAKIPIPLKAGTGSYTTYYSVTAEEAAVFPDYLTPGQLTTSSQDTYNKWIRWLAKAKAKITGNQYLLQNNYIKNKVVVEFYNKPIMAIPGRLSELKIDSLKWTDSSLGGLNYTKKLRNSNKTITIDKSGIKTQVTYEEDWELIQ